MMMIVRMSYSVTGKLKLPLLQHNDPVTSIIPVYQFSCENLHIDVFCVLCVFKFHQLIYIFTSYSCIVRVIKSRRKRWAGHVARMDEERGVYRVLVGKPEGRRPLGRPRRMWVYIRMDLQEVGCGYMNWIGLAQDRERWRTLVSEVMNLRVP